MSALRRMRETDSEIAFRPWIYEIARNAAIDLHRRKSRAEEVSISGESELPPADRLRLVGLAAPESALVDKERIEHLRGALDELSESHHRILVLRELEGLSYREIGIAHGPDRAGCREHPLPRAPPAREGVLGARHGPPLRARCARSSPSSPRASSCPATAPSWSATHPAAAAAAGARASWASSRCGASAWAWPPGPPRSCRCRRSFAATSATARWRAPAGRQPRARPASWARRARCWPPLCSRVAAVRRSGAMARWLRRRSRSVRLFRPTPAPAKRPARKATRPQPARQDVSGGRGPAGCRQAQPGTGPSSEVTRREPARATVRRPAPKIIPPEQPKETAPVPSPLANFNQSESAEDLALGGGAARAGRGAAGACGRRRRAATSSSESGSAELPLDF